MRVAETPAVEERAAAGILGGPEQLAELRRGVLLVLRHRVRDAMLAEDLCSETFRVVIERLQREPLHDPAALPAFLAQTARNLAIADWRKGARRRTVTGEQEAIETHADEAVDAGGEILQRQRTDAVRQVLAELGTARDRELLLRYYLRDEDKVAICVDLGLTEAHFNRVIFRARERFRGLLEKQYRRTDLLCLAL